MVKPEHRLEYNRWQAEGNKKNRNFILRFFEGKNTVFTLLVFFVSLMLVPLIVMLWQPRIFHPDYICGIRAKIVMVDTYHGYGILGNTADEDISKALRMSQPLYYHTAEVIEKILKPGDIAVDVGAGFGYHTMLMASRVGASGAVYAFEPRADVSHLLEASCLVNKFSQVKVKQALLYSSDSNVLLESFPGYMEASRIVVSKVLSDTKDQSLEMASSHRLDDLLHIGHVKLLRINAMGAELAILEGAQSLISHSPSISILMPWNPSRMSHYSNISAIIDDLTDLGFEFWMVESDGSLKLITKDVLLQQSGDVLISKDYIK